MHNYLILGNGSRCDNHRAIQAMCITSLRNHTKELEVPILMCNGMISYINPHSIYTFKYSDIKLVNYRGCLTTDVTSDDEDEFYNLLLDIYTYYITGIGYDKVKAEYDSYCDRFFDLHKKKTEYRQQTQQTKYPNKFDDIDENNKEEDKGSDSIVTKERININPPDEKPKEEFKVYKDPVRLNTNTNIGCIAIGAGFTFDKRPDGKFRLTGVCPSSKMKLEYCRAIDSYPRMIKMWTIDDIENFIVMVDKFGYKGIAQVSSRYMSANAMKYAYKQCKTELKQRKK